MVRSVVIARMYDGLPLAASMDDDDVQSLPSFQEPHLIPLCPFS